MASSLDRIRRILGDAPPGATPAPSPAPSPSDARRDALRRRLGVLGLERPDPGGPTAEERTRWPGADDARPLEEQTGGHLRTTPFGPCLVVERRYALDALHGRTPLDAALAHPIPLRPHERGASGRDHLAAADAVFLDTETTGLAGGTGTVAFLVGTGRVEGDDFVVRQYGMRDYPEEKSLLHALVEDLGNRPLVTFNGRSFDWPLLVTRLRLHRLAVAPRPHLDLLPTSRRLWVDSVPSHTLGTLEEHVLGLRREGDLPGWRIPEAFFDYLRSGRAGLVALAFRHNETDVVSMLALWSRIGAILGAPAGRAGATAKDRIGTSRLLGELGRHDDARACLEAGLPGARGREAALLRRQLGHLCRRAGEHDGALDHWTGLARAAPDLDVEAFEQVAKIHEHRRKDFAEALTWVEEALRRLPAGHAAVDAFRHRQQRLQRRLARSLRTAATGCGPRP